MTDADELRTAVREFLAEHDPGGDRLEFLRARFDAGLAWVNYPVGLGGRDAPRALQPVVDAEFAAAGAPDNDPSRNGIGLGMARRLSSVFLTKLFHAVVSATSLGSFMYLPSNRKLGT